MKTKLYHATLTPAGKQHLIDLCHGLSKFEAIAQIAMALEADHTTITARSLCLDVLNPAGFTTDIGEPFTGNSQGPCKLVASAWDYFQNVVKCPLVAKAIAEAFTDIAGGYAYDK